MAAAPSKRGEAPSPFDAAVSAPRDDEDLLKGAEKSGDVAAAAAALPPLKFRESPLFTRAPFILGTELCERLTYYGCAHRTLSLHRTNQIKQPPIKPITHRQPTQPLTAPPRAPQDLDQHRHVPDRRARL